MNNDVSINIENLSKCYSLQHSVKDAKGNSTYELWALKNISFEIERGKSVGIVGPNGSGKSTFLKILAGVTKPTSGRAEIYGRIASILDIGAGFHPELRGRENVFLNGQILGFSKNEIKTKFDEIVAFSGIEKFIDEPVKNYSNGMYLRLAFSIMVHLDFDVYLLDEVLSVGDVEFRTKCFDKISELVAMSDKTFVLISHNLNEISKISDTAFFLKDGIISEPLSIDNALYRYTNAGEKTTVRLPSFVKQASVEFKDAAGKTKTEFMNTEPITIEIRNSFHASAGNVQIGVRLTDRLNNVVFNSSPILQKQGLVEIDFANDKKITATIPAYLLNTGFFTVDLVYFNDNKLLDEIVKANYFTIVLGDDFTSRKMIGESGPLKPYLDWKIE
ncbi:MAG: Vitamin B12 import ATP-binding protein BtuD [Bacteroidia bacterium]|nr:Vitamin B12 import ATP-binding protein BtuD [Bacteroidia bacterium]